MHARLSLVLASLIGLAAPALAQGLGFGLGMHDVVARAGGGAAPLDGFTTPAGAYSFRKLKSNYAGPAAKLQRVDTTTQDIGFTASGDFDTAAAAAFCTTACTVQTWYDQSGNARHLVQAAAASQPGYIASCIGAKPCMQVLPLPSILMSAGNFTPSGSVISSSAVANRIAGPTANCNLIDANWVAGGGTRLTTGSVANIWTVAGSAGGFSAAATDNAWHTATVIQNGTPSSSITVDGVATTGSVTIRSGAGQVRVAGSATCNEVEAVFWDNYTLTAGEIAALTDNQRNYWAPAPLDSFATPSGAYSFRKLKSTYAGPAIRIRRASDNLETDINFLGCTGFTGCPWDEAAASAHCAATTCFIRTAYDQSGNARDAVQATVANQPQLIFNCNGALPCMGTTAFQFLAATVPAPNAVQSMSMVAKRTGGTATCQVASTATVNNFLFSATSANVWRLESTGALNLPATDGVWHAASGVLNGASSVLRVDAAEQAGAVTTGTGAGGIFYVSYGFNPSCSFGEAMYWGAYALTAGERAALQANQKSFWGTP